MAPLGHLAKPVLVVVNGLPGAGKTTLARRLADDLSLPVFSRDGLFETLYDALDCRANGLPPLLGAASFSLLYTIAGAVLSAGQSLIVEGFFGRADLRSAELLQLRRAHDFEPLQILCTAEGSVLLERFLRRMESDERHGGHQDRAWLAENRDRLLMGRLTPLALGGQTIEIETTTPASFDYSVLLRRVRAAL
jgi:predicted kinase